MSYVIKTWRDPYDSGFNTTSARKVILEEGLTVLIGCNGAGKSTFLKNVEEQVKKENIPILYFDQNGEGHRSNSIANSYWNQDFSFMSSMWTASEGEGIALNVGRIASELRKFLKDGETAKSRERRKWDTIFAPEKKQPKYSGKKRFILLDAIDSGYSIDNVLELKSLIELVMEDSRKFGVETFILVSANEFELACGERCLDVQRGKYLQMKSYPVYKRFILSSRKRKEKRMEKAEEWLRKQEEKETEIEKGVFHGRRKKKGWDD